MAVESIFTAPSFNGKARMGKQMHLTRRHYHCLLHHPRECRLHTKNGIRAVHLSPLQYLSKCWPRYDAAGLVVVHILEGIQAYEWSSARLQASAVIVDRLCTVCEDMT